MNEVFHITNTVNLNSIFKKGLLCAKPSLEHHEEAAKIGFKNYDERGLIYTIPYGCNSMEKYLKDSAYWKVWGRPRNDALNLLTYDDCIRYMNDGYKYFETIENKLIYEEHFSVLSIEVPDFFEMVEWIHCQTYDMSSYYNDMDCNFEHADNPLFIFNENLNCKIKVVGTIETQKKRNKKIEVILRGF